MITIPIPQRWGAGVPGPRQVCRLPCKSPVDAKLPEGYRLVYRFLIAVGHSKIPACLFKTDDPQVAYRYARQLYERQEVPWMDTVWVSTEGRIVSKSKTLKALYEIHSARS